MSARTELPPLRVEQALRLLPDIDVLAPLRAFLISTSRTRPIGSRTSGGDSEPDRTVGKRFLHLHDLRARVPQAIERVTKHLSALYEAAVQALEAEQRGDMSAAVRYLLQAAEAEEQIGRFSQAHQWYRHALGIAEELRDRRPEIAALARLGRLELLRGRVEEAGREYQRSLAVAEAELDADGAASAAEGLGDVAMALSQWTGAESWYRRGLRHAGENAELKAWLTLNLGEAAAAARQFDVATRRLEESRQVFETLRTSHGLVRAFNAQGLVASAGGRAADALKYFQEALRRLPKEIGGARLEMTVRVNMCQLYLDTGRYPDVEDEVRRAEELAITHNLTQQLARLYVIMGNLRGRQGDENGFIFFEKAIELCGGLEPSPRLEAEVYLEYGRFRLALHEIDEARAYFERAHEILELLGDGHVLQAIAEELRHLPPP